ncbi:class I SAM-dependent methyltransferase [Gordonia sp. VNK21]|uniref:class I SAM-dependent methyltransferase n=1 Tax=Gordonia sp. VNK21 TaxID=3382483 RepID=UPI0038D461E7
MSDFASRLMRSETFSRVYGLWRPLFTRGFSLGGSSTVDADRALRAYLSRPGERFVLDVACGPGNYAHDAAAGLTGDGRYLGLDFSPAMLDRAAHRHDDPRISFVCGDAHRLPLPGESVDTATCLAALYLIPDPLPVLDEMVRVLRPGGELIVFTSVSASVARLPGAGAVAGLSGLRIFGRTEITERLHALGMEQVEQTVTGFAQYVLARKPRR